MLGNVPARCWARFPAMLVFLLAVQAQESALLPRCSAQCGHVPACPAALLKMAGRREDQPAAAIKSYKTKWLSLHAAAMAPRIPSPS